MRTARNKTLWIFTILLIILLISCSKPEAGETPLPEEPTAPPATEVPLVEQEAPVFEIPAGTNVGWWDGNAVVYVPAGEFTMGADSQQDVDFRPAHTVYLDGYWIQRYEVTNRMYAQCVAARACQVPVPDQGEPDVLNDPAFENHPVTWVDWDDANSYCHWIGGRLPSEAEWEKAARGLEADPYPWGDYPPSCGLANYGGCLEPARTMPVGSYPLGESPFYLEDTIGNVFEWVNDYYDFYYYANSPAVNPAGPAEGDFRVARGGSFTTGYASLPVTTRTKFATDTRQANLGFRCVLNEEAVANPPPPTCQAAAFMAQVPPVIPPASNTNDPPWQSIGLGCYFDVYNNEYYILNLTFSEPVDYDQIELSLSEGDLSGCAANGPPTTMISCYISNFSVQTVVTVCDTTETYPQVVGATCPAFYTLQPSGMCEYLVPGIGSCQGQGDAVAVPGYGCMQPPGAGGCPLGTFEAAYNGQPVCLPVGGPGCYGQYCPAVCPPGLTFNEGQQCCDYPQDVLPQCLTGYVYDPNSQVCLPENPNPPGCLSMTMAIPHCQAPGDDEQPEPVGCWVESQDPFTGQTSTSCISPCPPGATPGGACTP